MSKSNQQASQGKAARQALTAQQRAALENEGVLSPEQVPELPESMRIDLHCHSQASPDSITPLEEIPERAISRGIRVQALTDHDVIWGAQELQQIVARRKIPNLTVIVGEEITTNQGELIGLFLKEQVPPGLSPQETAAAIHDQGGLVLLPHGFDPLRLPRLKAAARQEILSEIDIVETFNARISRPHWNRAAAQWAKKYELAQSAGSDAHTLADIGSAWVEVPAQDIAGPQELLASLRAGIPAGEWTHPLLAYLYKLWDRLRRKVRQLGR